jgi:2,3-bisphosphoglycerate-independent phosphoglycerate mutase
MKYLILVPDGAADVAVENEKTPLEAARMPAINGLAKRGRVGFVRTIPRGVAPGSDAANLAVLGYDPKKELTGRSPLEAVSMGIKLGERDVAFRANLVTLAAPEANGKKDSDADYEDLLIVDHASGDISDEEAHALIRYLDREIVSGDPASGGRIRLYPGVSYRHALIVRDGKRTESGIGDVFADYPAYALVPPHDILGRQIGLYLPDEENQEYLLALMRKSYELLKDHEINQERVRKGLRPANSIWIWGEGRRPSLAPITEKYGVQGTVISAVDLIKGIGICAGLEPVKVEGATGTISTNFRGKGAAAIDAFERGKDLAYIHVEAPDECAHQGNRSEKIEALERIDADIVAPVLAWLEKHRAETGEEFRILIVPDHRTPVVIRTHTDEPVPYVFYDSACAETVSANEKRAFTEHSAAAGEPIHSGRELADAFFGS